MYDHIIRQATIVRPEGQFKADVGIEDGKISAIGELDGATGRAETDARGMLLLPGFVDTHVHFRCPGHPAKEDWHSGSKAAAAGGVTSVCDMPNTSPPTVSRKEWLQKDELAARQSIVDYGIWAGAAAGNAEEIGELIRERLACGVKVFMGATTGPLLVDDKTLAAHFQITPGVMGVHAEDETLLNHFRERGRGQTTPDHSVLRPPEAAVEAVRRLIELCETWPREVHICHLSTAAELELLRARKQRLPITVEVCTHHLWLSTKDALGNWMKCNPPIRDEADRLAMWEALEAEVDSLASDHAPHTRAEKERGYWEAPSGIPGVETTLPLMLRGVWEGRLSLQRLVALGAQRPAEIFGLEGKGRVEVGKDADLVLVEPGTMRVLEEADLHTRVGWSPFTGWKMASAPREVWVRGRTVAKEGKIVAEAGSGRRIPLGPLTTRH